MFGKKQVLVIAGPTGSGESTFTNELLEAYENFTRLVSATTREPRLNEENGKNYYFFSKTKFFEEVEKGNIIEYTHVANRDAYYGSYRPDLEEKIKKGLIVVANTDVKGAQFFKENYGATTIFIKPKSLEVIEDRLRRRDTDISEDEVHKRLQSAQKEIDEAKNKYDYVVWNTDGEFANTLFDVVEILKKDGYQV
ncbi:MAG: guanylate kinase [bacterium]|nr:guanylate kinase [bacterium]